MVKETWMENTREDDAPQHGCDIIDSEEESFFNFRTKTRKIRGGAKN
jgi:hypothetical protein